MTQSRHRFKLRDAWRCLRLRLALRIYRLALLGVRRAAPGEPVRIGIFRRGGIGDWAVFVPALARYAAMFPAPAHRITVYGDARFAPFRFLSDVEHEFVAIDQARWRGSLRYRGALLRSVRRRGFAVWIDTDVSRNKVGLLLAHAAAAPHRYTLDAPHIDRCAARPLLARHFNAIAPVPAADEHESRRVARLVAFVADARGLPTPAAAPPPTPPAAPLTQPYLALFCGASAAVRAWPLARFAEVARRLHARQGLLPVFLGDDATPGLDALLAGTPALDLRRRTDAHELVAYLAHATLTVSNDSAGLHVAALFGGATLAIAPGPSFSRYCLYPQRHVRVVHRADTSCFDCEARCRYAITASGIYPCLDAIDVDMASAAAEAMLADLKSGSTV